MTRRAFWQPWKAVPVYINQSLSFATKKIKLMFSLDHKLKEVTLHLDFGSVTKITQATVGSCTSIQKPVTNICCEKKICLLFCVDHHFREGNPSL